jgi:hypothetical protein
MTPGPGRGDAVGAASARADCDPGYQLVSGSD